MNAQAADRKLLALGIPATLEHILQTLVGFVDNLLIAKIGLGAITAVGLANSLMNVWLAIFLAMGIAASSPVAKAVGAKHFKKAGRVAKDSLIISLLVGLFFALISLLFGRSLLGILGAQGDVLEDALGYFSWVAGTAPLLAAMTVTGSLLRASGNTKSPLKVGLWVNLINILLDYLLIFGFGPIPALGILGTALGTVLARLIGCLLLWRELQTSPLKISWQPGANYFQDLTKLAIPASLERLAMRLGQVLYFGLILKIGTKTFAAHSLAGTIESFSYMPAYGLAAAAGSLIGQSLGAKSPEDALLFGRRANRLGCLIMIPLGALLFFLGPNLARIFTEDPQAISQVATALKIDGLAQPALAISLITTGSLQGMGDTTSPFLSTLAGMWLLRVFGVWFLGIQLNLGIAGIWLAIALDLTGRSIFLWARFRQGLSKQIPETLRPL